MEPQVLSRHPPKLLDRVRAELRVRHYRIRTEEVYVDWARRFIRVHAGALKPDEFSVRPR